MLAHKCTTSLIAKLLIAILLVLVLPTLVSAQSSGGGSSSGGGGSSAATGDKDDAQPGNAGNIKKNYYLRYPAAKEFSKTDFGGKDATTDPKQGPEESKGPGLVQNDKSGPLQLWPEVVKGPVFSKVPTLRDTAIQQDLFKTFGYPVSDTQFQVIQRYNDNRLLEELYDPERIMWMSTAMAQIQTVAVANSTANLARNQASSAIEYDQHYLQNFTTDNGNAWNTIRNQLFVPMAILLLLPGAVMAQVKVIIQQGSPVLGDAVNPFEGIIRSIIAIFFIPATYLVVNYGIDVSNSLGYTIASEYQRVFQSDMYHDAACTEARAFPINTVPRNAIDAPTSSSSSSGSGGGSASPFNQVDNTMDITTDDPCKEWQDTGGAGKQNVQNEQQKYITAANRALVNSANAGLTGSWNVMCAFQMVYLQYLFLMGPIVAALWVWPIDTMRKALGGWVEGVVTICFWSLFWNTVILLLACFKGVSETGVIYVSALNTLANIAVRYAFSFADVTGQMGASAGQKASSTGAKSMQGGKGGGAPGGGAAVTPGSKGAHGGGAQGGGVVGGDAKGGGAIGGGEKKGAGGGVPSMPGLPGVVNPGGAPHDPQKAGGDLGGGALSPGVKPGGGGGGDALRGGATDSTLGGGGSLNSATNSPHQDPQAGAHPGIPMTTPQNASSPDAGGIPRSSADGNVHSGAGTTFGSVGGGSAISAAMDVAGGAAALAAGASMIPSAGSSLEHGAVSSSMSSLGLGHDAGKTTDPTHQGQTNLANLHPGETPGQHALQQNAHPGNLQHAEGIVPGTTSASAGFGTTAAEHAAASAIPTSSTSASPSLTGEAISALHPPSATGAVQGAQDPTHAGAPLTGSATQFADAHAATGAPAAAHPAQDAAHLAAGAPAVSHAAQEFAQGAGAAITQATQDASHTMGAAGVASGTAAGTGAHFAQEAASAMQHGAQAAAHEVAHAPQMHQAEQAHNAAPQGSAPEVIAYGGGGGGGYTPAPDNSGGGYTPAVGYDVPAASPGGGGGYSQQDTSSPTGSGSGSSGYEAAQGPSGSPSHQDSGGGPLYGAVYQSSDNQTYSPAQHNQGPAPESSSGSSNYADQGGGGYAGTGGPSHDSYASGSSDSGSSGSGYSGGGYAAGGSSGSGSSGGGSSAGGSYGGYAAGAAAGYLASQGSGPALPPSTAGTGKGGGAQPVGPSGSAAGAATPASEGQSSSGWQASVDKILAQSAGQGKGLTKEELEKKLQELAELERQKNQPGGTDIS
jgi:hypothetical protein